MSEVFRKPSAAFAVVAGQRCGPANKNRAEGCCSNAERINPVGERRQAPEFGGSRPSRFGSRASPCFSPLPILILAVSPAVV
eukprot:3200514-Rhodomonas_salina.1